ncbi:MAG: radical SAM protein [Candidatus Omnitrophica bacterium]|nr:radical SAM protein [Candidatus Omnitrophota bacterium]MDD5591920.1 radical SAM protein [Candidatus Omnitrophota bacterium]
MKIALLEIKTDKKECINKDFMGGYGWAFNVGNSFRANLINRVKKWGESLPIMSLGYLASIFYNNGHRVEHLINEVPDSDMVIIPSSMVDYKHEINWAREIRRKGIKVGFFGPFSSAMPELFLKYSDFVIGGEPEEIAAKITDKCIPQGFVKSNPVKDLDTLPFPKWDIFNISAYSYVPALKEVPFLPILSSRGCSFACSYCPYLVNYTFRERSSENVLEEIGYLVDRFKIKGMLFRDPIFSLNKKRTVEITEGMMRRNYKIKWACETRLDLLDEKLIDILYASGLRVINVGIESADSDVLEKATRKAISMEHQEKIIRYCEKKGVRVTVFYILGLPDDTEESIAKTVGYAKKLNTHVAQFFIFTPFPGTKYFESIKDRLEEKDWEKFNCYTPVIRHKNFTKERLLELKERAFVSYYYRPAWALKFIKRVIRDVWN